MTDARAYARLQALYERAQALPPEQREAFVARVRAEDAALGAELADLFEPFAPAGAAGRILSDEGLQAARRRLEDVLAQGTVAPAEAPRARHLRLPMGELELRRELGRGGMGVVWLAYDPALKREVAVKELAPQLAYDPACRERFCREAQAMARLRHPGIVTIHATDEHGTPPCFVMDLLPGPTLASELQRASAGETPAVLPPFASPQWIGAVVERIAAVADALHFAHEQGVIHRDVKPGNLLFARDGRLVLVDFGLARMTDVSTITQRDAIQGSPHYMSPEQVRPQRHGRVDARSDVYALGVVLYELLTLRRPFDSPSLHELFEHVELGKAVPVRKLNPEVPRDLEVLCSVAMARAPGDRFASAAEFAADLRRFLAHQAIHAQPLPTLVRIQRALARNAGTIALTLLGAAAALWAGAWLRAEWSARATRPRLTLTVRDAQGREVAGARGEVFVRPIDELSGQVGEPRSLGPLPVRARRLEAGWQRVVVALADGTRSEATRHFPADGSELEVARVARAPAELAARDMVRFEGTTWRNPQTPTTCPNATYPVTLAPFWLDRCEVSNAQYREFLLATGRAAPPPWGKLDWRTPGLRLERSDGTPVDFDTLPAVGMSWPDAQAYAEWAGLRLPTHAEWEWAARGPENRAFPWGEQPPGVPWPGATRAPRIDYDSLEEGLQLYLDGALAVTSAPEAATPEGVLHLLGNVAEFTETPVLRVGDVRAEHDERYVMGGAWDVESRGVSLANAHEPRTIQESEVKVAADQISLFTGFRCARSVAP